MLQRICNRNDFGKFAISRNRRPAVWCRVATLPLMRQAHNERMVDYMTKAELLKEFDKLEKEKGVHIDGIYYNSKKSAIENAIECLKCPDELLDKYLMIVSLKYENIGRVIAENGDFKHHSHNRLYVFNTARMILAN